MVKVLLEESTAPSFAFTVIVAWPLQFVAGVKVRVAPERLATTFEVDEATT